MNIRSYNIATHRRSRADKYTYGRLILLARFPIDILDDNISDSQRRRVCEAGGEVLLSITLLDFDGVVDVVYDPVF